MEDENITKLQEEISALQQLLNEKQRQLHQLKQQKLCSYSTVFSSEEVVRYSRQMVMPQIGPDGQAALKNSKILVVGAGGLGCPACLYLAAAGIGEIHVVDYDHVELSNLHRQILHNEHDQGVPKANSVCCKLQKINSCVKVKPLQIHATSSMTDLFESEKYDVVLDCSDNAPTRYLLNDLCVLFNVPLVSGSALQLEGQLTVYHYKNGPCYRCMFPTPPPADSVTNCGDGGVLGAVTGVIGSLQALETIKIITGASGVLSGRLLLFDGSETIFRNVKLRPRSAKCDVCGDSPKITKPIDYELFCGSKAHDKVVDIDVLRSDDNLDIERLDEILERNVVLDVRSELEYKMCKLPNTVNVPFTLLQSKKGLSHVEEMLNSEHADVYVLCRRGNDSQRSVKILKEHFPGKRFVNLKGGLHAYSKMVDPDFPAY